MKLTEINDHLEGKNVYNNEWYYLKSVLCNVKSQLEKKKILKIILAF